MKCSAPCQQVMKEGRITQAGKYNDILNYGSDFVELVGAHKKALSALESIEAEKSSIMSENSVDTGSTSEVVPKEENRNGQTGNIEGTDGPKAQLVQEEEREKGKVGFSVYWKYITTAYGGALVPFILLSQILFQLLQIGSNYWMAWATPVSEDVKPAVGGSTLILVYVALAIGSSLCVLSRAMLVVTAGYRTATILFNKMHLSIFRAPMSFFDATPSGRILNRVSEKEYISIAFFHFSPRTKASLNCAFPLPLTGFYRPKCSGHGYSNGNMEMCFLIHTAPGNYCSHVPSRMAGFHCFCPHDCNLHLVSGDSHHLYLLGYLIFFKPTASKQTH